MTAIGTKLLKNHLKETCKQLDVLLNVGKELFWHCSLCCGSNNLARCYINQESLLHVK
jgi:hypothetical protein